MQTGMTQLSLFQFTPLHERQPTGGAENTATQVFQFTPLHERQHGHLRGCDRRKKFQFTPLHERQPVGTVFLYSERNFNSRLYMRGSSKNAQFFQ